MTEMYENIQSTELRIREITATLQGLRAMTVTESTRKAVGAAMLNLDVMCEAYADVTKEYEDAITGMDDVSFSEKEHS